ncbi:MAG: SOUL family heme-binding protein, partial [Rubripirellula sp.]
GAPEPSSDGVRLYTRRGGKFAVIRFSGRMNDKLADEHEKRLRAWMKRKQLEGEASADTAGYDAPFTPGPFRRNEVLIRIAEPKVQSETKPQAESENQNEPLAENKS